VVESIYAFPNIKINSVFNQEISRNFISSNEYQEKRDRGKRRESECVREKEGERERERVCVQVYGISSSLISMSESITSPPKTRP